MILTRKSDTLGVIASSLCLVHCIATPFIFVVQSYAASHSETAPTWWKLMDYFFLLISFFAVYWSARNTAKTWMKYALWVSWAALLIGILNEKGGWFSWPEITIYFPALGLVFLHVYNKKFCQCNDEDCCTDPKNSDK